jgi:hypothetical protein
MDGAKLGQRLRLVGTLFVLSVQVERLARVLPGLIVASHQTTHLAELYEPAGMIFQHAHASIFANRLFRQRAPLREASLERIALAQARRDQLQISPVAGATTEGQALFQHPDGMLQVPFGEVQSSEVVVDNNRGSPSAFQRGKAEHLLLVAPALGECPEHAQGMRQPRPGLDPHVCTGPTRGPVRNLYAPLQELDRPAEVNNDLVCLPQVIGCFHLQGALAELSREREGLLARRTGAGLPAVGHGFVPYFAPQGMVRQAVDARRQHGLHGRGELQGGWQGYPALAAKRALFY